MTVLERARELERALVALGVADMRVVTDPWEAGRAYVDIYRGRDHLDSIEVDPEKGFGFFPIGEAFFKPPELWVADVSAAVDEFKKRYNIP